MTTLFEKLQWNSDPTAYWTIKYEYQRSGVNMQYRFYWKVWLNSSTSWYYDGLQLRLFINGVQNNVTVKGYNSGEKGWSYEGTTGWYTVSNKTSGTVPFYAKLYDTNAKVIEIDTSSKPSYPSSLTVAPAASVLSNISSFDVGNEIAIGITKYNTAFTDTLVISYGSTAIKTVAGITNGAKVTFTNAELTTIYGLMKAAKSGTFTFLLTTKNGSSTIGTSTQTASGSISNANPTFTADQLSYSDSDNSIVNVTKNNKDIISGKSSLQIAYTPATGNKGATISKYEFTLNGVTKTATAAGGTVDFGKILTDKDLILTVKVTDSRDNSTTIEKTIPFIMYSEPIIGPHTNYGKIICERCDDEGVLSKKGNRLKLAVKGKWNTLPSGNNTAKLQIKCASNTYNSGWVDIEAVKQGGNEANNYIAWYDVNAKVEGLTLNIRTIYTITIRIWDALTPEDKAPSITFKIPTSAATFHLAKKGLKAAFGMYAQREKALQIAEDWTLDVLGDMEIRGKKLLDYFQPIGSIFILPENTNPTAYFGGEWQLIDKGFSSIATDGTTEYFTPASNVEVVSVYWSRGGHDISIRLGLKINTALNDDTLSLGAFDWSKFGVDGLHFGWNAVAAYSDAANGGIMCNIAWDTGAISHIEVIDTESIAAGNTFYFDLHLTFSYVRMLDSACNKFYWERVK